jgi:CheY-like chemotaxis protein
MIIDDEESARKLMRAAIKWDELGMEVVGEAASGVEAINIIDDLKPDIAFVDISMPFMDGIEFTEIATNRYPHLVIIIMTAIDKFEYARKCVSMPVFDYMLKPMVREEINELTEDKSTRRLGVIYGKRYVNIVQFDIFAANYAEANEVMKNFEELIFDYSSYLKENGIAEIYQKKRFTDRNLDAYRQHFSVRSLQYYVETEKLFARFGGVVETILPLQ